MEDGALIAVQQIHDSFKSGLLGLHPRRFPSLLTLKHKIINHESDKTNCIDANCKHAIIFWDMFFTK